VRRFAPRTVKVKRPLAQATFAIDTYVNVIGGRRRADAAPPASVVVLSSLTTTAANLDDVDNAACASIELDSMF
jgi:hypothetical protein